MMKNITMNLKHLVLTFTLAIFAVAANAATVTYSLTTHSFTIDGQEHESRTITGTANLNEGADLLDNMPQALWRAYCTYTFTNEEGQPITTAPANGGTVYVDYVFDPPFIMSVEGAEPTWNYLRSYNSNGSNNYIVYYHQDGENELGSNKQTIKGWKSTGTNPTPTVGRNRPLKKVGHDQWAFYGDPYNFFIKVNDAEITNPWLIWRSTSSADTPMGLGNKPAVGWQLYVNTATNSKLSGGTVAMGPYNATNYLASLENVSSCVETDKLDTSKQYFDSHNQLVHNKNTSMSGTYKNDLWWYALFATPTSESPTSTDLWHVTYKILKADGISMYPDYVMQKHSLNPEALWPPTGFTLRDGYEYDRFYTDANFTQKLEGDMPDGENTVLYIKEKPIEYVAEQWKTLVLPYSIENLNAYFGEGGVRVLEYTSVEGQLNGDAFRCNLIFTPVNDNRIEAYKPYLFKADHVSETVLSGLRHTVEGMDEKEDGELKSKEIKCSDDINARDIKVAMKGVLKDGGITLPDDDLHFFFGSYPNRDVENYEDYTYKFYRQGGVTIPQFVCYFYVSDERTGNNAPIKASFGTESITGVSTIVADIKVQNSIYSLDGRKIDATSLDNLKRGIYIVNGRKVVK